MLDKAIDFMADGRNPAFLLLNLARRSQLKEKLRRIEIPKNTKVRLAITFDVEYDFGSAGKQTAEFAGPFLERMGKILGEKTPATFFVQGNLVSHHHKQLLALQRKGHEIGLHGWAHEPWGNAWFINERLPSRGEREGLLEKSLSEFEKYGLRRPVSFRAPNMVIRGDSLALLEKHGFGIDSSAPSFRGGLPQISKIGKMAEIPVSYDPLPTITGKMNSHYRVLNAHNLAASSEIAENAVKFQLLSGQKPLLVFLGHSWEFFGNEKFKYCGPRNFKLLMDFVNSPAKNLLAAPGKLSSFAPTFSQR